MREPLDEQTRLGVAHPCARLRARVVEVGALRAPRPRRARDASAHLPGVKGTDVMGITRSGRTPRDAAPPLGM